MLPVKVGTSCIVANAHVQGIIPLPTIYDTHPQKSFDRSWLGVSTLGIRWKNSKLLAGLQNLLWRQ